MFDPTSKESVFGGVSIIVTRGLGKTVLAQLVYNDGKERDHFKLMVWVRVSDVFDVDLIIKETLKSAQQVPYSFLAQA